MKKLIILFLGSITCFVTNGQTDSISIVLSDNTGKDAWVWSWANARSVNFGEPNAQNSGLHNVTRAETWQWTAGTWDTIRSLMYFQLPEFISPANLTAAYLELDFFKNPNFQSHTGANQAMLVPIDSPWDEATVNWNTQPTTSATPSVLLSASHASNQNYRIDVTTLVNHQMATNTNGWALKLTDENGGYSALTFGSSETQDVEKRPRLILHYEATNASPKYERGVIKLGPNPVQHILTVTYPNQEQRTHVLIDLQGNIMKHVVANQSQLELNLSGVPTGFYLLHIQSGDSTQAFPVLKK